MNSKIILLLTLALPIAFFAFIIFQGKSQGSDYKIMGDDAIAASPSYFNLNEVDIDGGIVTKEYSITNLTGKPVTLRKIVTSCMCTQAKVIAQSGETKFFGMEHAGDKNALLNLELKENETARVIVDFDPAAHGPQGVGPFDRTIWLTFSDPGGVKELKFDGIVVKK